MLDEFLETERAVLGGLSQEGKEGSYDDIDEGGLRGDLMMMMMMI